MARAGFYAIHTETITFARDGRWYADGEPIVHPRLARLFSRHLRRKPENGGFEINIDDQYRADVVVEDTPVVIVGVDVQPDAVWLHLNDETVEALDPSTLHIGPEDVLYATVRGGSERARFLRSAYMHLADRFEPHPSGGFAFRNHDAAYPIAYST